MSAASSIGCSSPTIFFDKNTKNIIVIVREGEKHGDRENEGEDQRGDQGVDDDPLARHAPHRDEARESAQRNQDVEASMTRIAVVTITARPRPTQSPGSFCMIQPCRWRSCQTPEEHRRGDRHADRPRSVSRGQSSRTRRASGEKASPEVFRRRRARRGSAPRAGMGSGSGPPRPRSCGGPVRGVAALAGQPAAWRYKDQASCRQC